MWQWFDDLFDHEDPKSGQRWRRTVAKFIFFLTVSMISVVLALTTGLPVVGKVVYERDLVEKVAIATRSQSSDIDAIKAEQVIQGAKIDALLRVVNDSNATTISAQLRLMKAKRCRSIDVVEREWIQREMEKLQDQYFVIRGLGYVVPDCGDL